MFTYIISLQLIHTKKILWNTNCCTIIIFIDNYNIYYNVYGLLRRSCYIYISTGEKGGKIRPDGNYSFLLPPFVVLALCYYIFLLYGNFRKHFCSATAPVVVVFGSLDNTKEEVGKERFR